MEKKTPWSGIVRPWQIVAQQHPVSLAGPIDAPPDPATLNRRFEGIIFFSSRN